MKVRFLAVVVLLVLLGATLWWRSGRAPAPAAPTPTSERRVAPAPGADSVIARLARDVRNEDVSPIAQELNARTGSIERDIAIFHLVFEAWRTNFPHDGHPIGDNADITAALAGANSIHFAFVSPRHAAINTRGELCDRWGTPFRFHAVSGTEIEIWSAGPDRRFATEDDVRR